MTATSRNHGNREAVAEATIITISHPEIHKRYRQFNFAFQECEKDSLRIVLSIYKSLCMSVSVCLSVCRLSYSLLTQHRNIFAYTDFVQFVGHTVL